MNKPLHVLIVEDNQDDVELLVYQLERSGYNVDYQCVDTLEAMTTALEKEGWDIVLADYSLPRFSAVAALTLLQEKGLDIPFIVVSGCISDEIAVAALKAGAHDYLMKGNLARLIPAIERELQETISRRERQRIQSELRESEDRWQLALRGTNDGIWDWNIKTNAVFFSTRWKEMLGYEEQEIANHFDAWYSIVHPDDTGKVTQALQDHFTRKTEFYRVEHRLHCKNGRYKWILSRGQALWDETGNPIRMLGSHTDITPTKKLEEALRQQAESLAEANRLKDEFLAIVSHELRTPLNPILGWAQILRSRKLEQSATQQALETIERNAKLQKQLVEDLLDVSRIIQGKVSLEISPINLVPIVEAAMETVKIAAEAKNITLHLIFNPSIKGGQGGRGAGGAGEAGANQEENSLPPTPYSPFPAPLLVLGDANRLQQVVWNLLSNAIKFTPDGGQVEIRLSAIGRNLVDGGGHMGESSLPTTYHLPPTKYAQIAVRDTGIGIKPEFLPYVFDRFRQENSSTTRSYGGLGLGLALVRHLVELHGGTVQADSPGEAQGTTFTVKLPLLKDEGRKMKEELTPPSPLTPHTLPLAGLQILVVDDNADNLKFLVFTLTEYGANTITAASAQEALAAFKRFKLDAIVSDLGMPEEDGYALIRQVRVLEVEQGRRQIPAVAVSGYARDSDRHQSLADGFQMHLSKPIDPSKLVEAIAQLSQCDFSA